MIVSASPCSWHVNQFTGQEHGEADTIIVRPAITFRPSDGIEVILRYEYFESDNDGPAGQGHALGDGTPGVFTNFDRESFDFAIDETGFLNSESDFLSAEANFDVDFGEGQVTYLFGWRDYQSEGISDIDASPVFLFHAPNAIDDEQISHELRYTGRFGNTNVTAGVFQFSKDMLYAEDRLLPLTNVPPFTAGTTWNGGGDYSVDQWSVFLALDFDVSDRLTLTAGANYSEEDKDAAITSLVLNINPFGDPSTWCNVVAGTCTADFIDSDSWDAFSPKLGARYNLSDDSQVYGHWTRGFRSGGYNLRNTSFDVVNLGPGPFDQETVDSFEIGYKSNLGGRGQLNAAVFYTEIEDMQRELNFAGPAGVIQVIRNTADAEILGAEADLTINVGAGTLFTTSVGVLDGEYATVLFDLNRDGVVDSADESLKIPRLPELTWSVGLVNDYDLGDWGVLTSRINYAYRDAVAYTDDNLGTITDQEILTAGLDLYSNDGRWVFSLYGNNLLNDVKHGGDTQLSFGQTFSPLAKGRVVGAEVSYNF
jgi:iron complex outermembrane receptor protein